MKPVEKAPDGTAWWWKVRIPRKDKKKIKYKCDIEYTKLLLINWNLGDIEIHNEKYTIWVYSNYMNPNYNPFNLKDYKYKKGGYKIWKRK